MRTTCGKFTMVLLCSENSTTNDFDPPRGGLLGWAFLADSEAKLGTMQPPLDCYDRRVLRFGYTLLVTAW